MSPSDTEPDAMLKQGWSWPLPLKATPLPALIPLTNQESAEILTRAALAYQRAHRGDATQEDYDAWRTAVAAVNATGRGLVIRQEDLEPDTEAVHTFTISYTGVITPAPHAHQTQTKEAAQTRSAEADQTPSDQR